MARSYSKESWAIQARKTKRIQCTLSQNNDSQLMSILSDCKRLKGSVYSNYQMPGYQECFYHSESRKTGLKTTKRFF